MNWHQRLRQFVFFDIVRTLFSSVLLCIAITLRFAERLCQTCKSKYLDKKESNTLLGKVVLITGASSGIGESLAHAFYKKGCKLILASRRPLELDRVKSELLHINASSLTAQSGIPAPKILQVDMGDLSSLPTKAKDALKLFGSVDILINNAGIVSRATVAGTDLATHRKIMDVNYFGALSFTKVILQQMKRKSSGHIVFISSVQGKFAVPFCSAYAASKHAMQALADSLRAEVHSFGVKVTVLSPGYVNTPIIKNSIPANSTSSAEEVNKIATTSNENSPMAKNLAQGYSADYIAERVVKAVMNNENDIVIASLFPTFLILVRNFFPSIFYFLMTRVTKRASDTELNE